LEEDAEKIGKDYEMSQNVSLPSCLKRSIIKLSEVKRGKHEAKEM
jgi:hypothetical protein